MKRLLNAHLLNHNGNIKIIPTGLMENHDDDDDDDDDDNITRMYKYNMPQGTDCEHESLSIKIANNYP